MAKIGNNETANYKYQVLGETDNGLARILAVDDYGRLSASSQDIAGRSGINGVFGGTLSLSRVTLFAANFSYGVDTRRTEDRSTNGGTVGFDSNMIAISSGTASNGTGVAQSKRHVRYVAGKDAEIMGTLVFDIPVAGNRQMGGLFDENDGFAIGYEETEFVVFRKRAGIFVEKVLQENFNIDKLDGNGASQITLNPQTINVFRIVYGYLGIATIYFEIYDGSKFVPFHKIELANNQSDTHVLNPYLPVRLESTNFGNTTDIVVKSASIYAGILDGDGRETTARRFAVKRDDVALTASTDARLVVFHNKASFNSIENNVEDLLHTVSIGVKNNKPVVVSMFKLSDAYTKTGTWTDKDTINSNMEYSFDATVAPSDIASGDLLASWVLGETGQVNRDVSSSRHLLFPDEYAVLTYSAGSGSTGNVSYSIQWDELF